MKKIISILVFIIITSNLSAQFYTGGGLGFSFGATPRVNGKEVKTNEGVISTTNIYGSYGEGFSGAIKFGYFFNEHLGIELNLGYLNGAEQTKSDVLIGIDGYLINNNSSVKTDAIAYSQLFRSSLSVVYKTAIGFYGRFGFYIPLGGKTIVEANDFRIFETEINGQKIPLQAETKFEQEIKGEPSLGFTGAAGYTYDLGDNFNIFAEVEYLGLSIKSKEADFTKYQQTISFHQINGGAIIKETTLVDLGEGKHTKYVDTVKSTDNYPGNPNFNETKEIIDFKQSAPYDSFGINIGIMYKFN